MLLTSTDTFQQDIERNELKRMNRNECNSRKGTIVILQYDSARPHIEKVVKTYLLRNFEM